MKGYHLANLSQPPSRILVGDGNLTEEKREWSQPAQLWTLIYYEHRNSVTQQNESALVEPGDIVLFAPAVRGEHARVGDDTWFQYFTFDLPGIAGGFEALPRHIPGMSHIFGDLRRASARITDTALPAVAFVWGFLWSIATPKSKHRAHEGLYLAEAFIRKNLERRVSVEELAGACEISSRQLLRMFREEHNQTVSEFIRQARVKEAARLLLETDLPVKGVAARVGYQDLQEFNKLIRASTGASPTAFRAKK